MPHLLSPVIVHPKRAAEALQWIVREMELRYEMLATVGVRDIDCYEEGLRDGTLRIPPGMEDRYEHMPFIVVVIDELADLMMVAPREVEDAICRSRRWRVRSGSTWSSQRSVPRSTSSPA